MYLYCLILKIRLDTCFQFFLINKILQPLQFLNKLLPLVFWGNAQLTYRWQNSIFIKRNDVQQTIKLKWPQNHFNWRTRTRCRTWVFLQHNSWHERKYLINTLTFAMKHTMISFQTTPPPEVLVSHHSHTYNVQGVYKNTEVVEEKKLPEPSSCFTWGGYHYKTFDGKVFRCVFL